MKLKEIMFIGEEDPEKGYTAQALGYSIFTEGDTLEELKENIKDALKCHFDKIIFDMDNYCPYKPPQFLPPTVLLRVLKCNRKFFS